MSPVNQPVGITLTSVGASGNYMEYTVESVASCILYAQTFCTTHQVSTTDKNTRIAVCEACTKCLPVMLHF